MSLSHDELLLAMDYDIETGVFVWKFRPSMPKQWNTRYAATVAGSPNNRGYLNIGINGKLYKAHRLAWFYVTKHWPTSFLDHIDMNKTNNSLKNLRLATKQQNSANRRAYSNNKCGLKGVSFDKKVNMWRAVIKVNYKQKLLGYFSCPAAAHLAYIVAADVEFGPYSRAA